MSFFDQLLGQLFPQRGPKGPQRLVHEVLTRSARFQSEYAAWRAEPSTPDQLAAIVRAYYLKQTRIEVMPPVHVLRSAPANGFALTYHAETFAPKAFRFLLDYLRDRVTGIGYRQVDAIRTITDKGSYVEEIEKYYLKPAIRFDPHAPGDQRYGNVLIENAYIDDRPSYLKLVASVYSDSLYREAQPFSDLMEILFTVDK